MKKHLLTCLSALFFINTYAQTTIKNPEYNTSTVDGNVTQLDLLPDAIALHFSAKIQPKMEVYIPKESYIKPVGSETKYFATHAKGVTLGEKFRVPDNGEVNYTLYFPKLPQGTKAIDFDEFNVGHWEIKGMNITPAPIPSTYIGNWLLADGSNLWKYGFYQSKVVANKKVWSYDKTSKKGKYHLIHLKRPNETLTLWATTTNNGQIKIGTQKKDLTVFSNTKINNPNFKSNETLSDTAEPQLKNGTATYSGIVRNFNKNSGQKTGKISVDNIFTGDQDSYLVEINDDGSFSVSFPSYHLQQVYVQLPGYYNGVFVEPGKETWQLINSNDRSEGFFAGDLAQLNTDFSALSSVVYNFDFYNKIVANIKNFSPQEYKEECFKDLKKKMAQLDGISTSQSISETAYNLMALELKFRAYENALSYDMHKRTSYQDKANVNKAYIDFVTPEVLNTKNAVLASSYDSFINRLRFLRHLREGISVKNPDIVELAKLLKDQGVMLTDDEQELVELHHKYNKENAEAIKKREAFNKAHQDISRNLGTKLGSLYQKMTKEEQEKFFPDRTIDLANLETFAKSKNMEIVFTNEEKKFLEDSKNLLTKEEQERSDLLHSEENNKRNVAFSKKYKSHSDAYLNAELNRQTAAKIRENLGDNISAKIIIAQQVLESLEANYTPLSDVELLRAKEEIAHPFIAEVIAIENDKLKAKIEANKTKTGFVVNKTPETTADKVFDNIISKYKGKVIFVDFWATWCGPCKSGMKQIKPLKADLKDEDIVFVYITNQTSPEKTWNNMIPDVKGEHYRVSEDEWNYLSSKFNITGIPHYVLVNKKGEVVNEKIYFASSNETLRKLFDEYL